MHGGLSRMEWMVHCYKMASVIVYCLRWSKLEDNIYCDWQCDSSVCPLGQHGSSGCPG